MKVGIISLGCPKNQIDAEHMLALLDSDGFEIVDYYDGADAVIINTCGFIDAAKEEAVENILEIIDLKNDGIIGKIIVSGCLAELHKDEISKEFPEVDAVIGIGAVGNICEIVKNTVEGNAENSFPDKSELPLDGQRIITSPGYWAYLKIADGCNNRCTYCTIPQIRGNFRSRKKESILEEARALAENGVKELVLVAQDTTNYGSDIYGELMLPRLLEELSMIDGIKWIRMLYCYPDKVTDELIDVMARNPKVLPYIDLPLQHADDKILRAMNRKGTQEEIRSLILRLRERLPDVVIRTTFITGFPGEEEEEFDTLAAFVNEMEFDRLGCFSFSPQEGTPAFSMDNQVDEQVKIDRGEIIMQDQLSIVELKNSEKVGKTYEVLVEGYDGYSDSYYGRTYMDAPEIDGKVSFTGPDEYFEGEFVNVEIIGVNEYDLIGRVV